MSKCGDLPGLYFPLFGMNTDIYSVNFRIQSEYRKIWTRKNSVFGHFSCSDICTWWGFSWIKFHPDFLCFLTENQFKSVIIKSPTYFKPDKVKIRLVMYLLIEKQGLKYSSASKLPKICYWQITLFFFKKFVLLKLASSYDLYYN